MQYSHGAQPEHKTIELTPFITEAGVELARCRLAFTVYGSLNAAQDNVVCIVHPFTANPNPQVWWPDLVGPGRLFDPARYCIVCINVPGSPYGSEHPLDTNPRTGAPYYYDFPLFTPRDVARCFDAVFASMGIREVRIAVGSSMGGQITFQWLISGRVAIRRAIIIAANHKITPWMLASHHVQRGALYADPTWGDKNPDAGKAGMKIARQIGFLSYRSPLILSLFHTLNMQSNPADEAGFFETAAGINNEDEKITALKSYIEYQGAKFLQRFNAFSYHALLALMDSHDIGAGGLSAQQALSRITSDVLLVGVDSDILFPPHEIRDIARHIQRARYREISSVYGHDAFLIEYKQLEDIIADYLYEVDEHYLAHGGGQSARIS